MTRNQLTYHANLEAARANKAKEAENYRSNLAKEIETNRSNLANESETHRSNIQKEKVAKFNAGANAAIGAVNAATKLIPLL